MQTDWQTFLDAQGAVTTEGTIRHFGNPAEELNAAANAEVLCELGQFGVLRVSGPDASSFLQNLLSNDLREVTATRAQYSSFNTAKGRMLATFLIWREGEDYLLQLPRSLTPSLQKKLSLYVLRAKVKITDASCEIILLGKTSEPEGEILSVSENEGIKTIRVGKTRIMLAAPAELAQNLWLKLAEKSKPSGGICWDWLNIRAGIPVILPQTQEQFVPQMANLDLIGGISFKKGCYPGQEIVARMHYLGKLKRRMYLAHINEKAQAGDALYADDDTQACGMIANAAPAPSGGYDVLAVMQTENCDKAHLAQGATLSLEALPYPLP